MADVATDFADNPAVMTQAPSQAQSRSLSQSLMPSDRVLSVVLIVVLPMLFWMGVLEVAALAFGFDYGMVERLTVMCGIGVFLAIVRGCISVTRL